MPWLFLRAISIGTPRAGWLAGLRVSSGTSARRWPRDSGSSGAAETSGRVSRLGAGAGVRVDHQTQAP